MLLNISSQLLGGLLQSLFLFTDTDQHNAQNSALTRCFLAFYSPNHRGFSCQPLPALLIKRMVRQERTLQQIILNNS